MEIVCKACSRKFNGQRGISMHVLQHSKLCLQKYIELYGDNKINWPEDSYLKIQTCPNCNEPVKDPRSYYCAKCRHYEFNVMKDCVVSKKNQETNFNKPKEYKQLSKQNLSIKGKERYKNRPELRLVHKNYMLKGGAIKARNRKRFVSTDQEIIYQLLISIFKSTEQEFPVQVREDKGYNIDIAIPELMIAIEHDPSPHDSEYDFKRQNDLENVGWKFIRILGSNFTEKDILEKIHNIREVNNG